MTTKRGPGRPRKIQDVEETVVTTDLLPVKHVVRAISQQGIDDPNGLYFSAETVEKRLAEYYNQGYELFATHYVGNVPEGTSIVILYILKFKEA